MKLITLWFKKVFLEERKCTPIQVIIINSELFGKENKVIPKEGILNFKVLTEHDYNILTEFSEVHSIKQSEVAKLC